MIRTVQTQLDHSSYPRRIFILSGLLLILLGLSTWVFSVQRVMATGRGQAPSFSRRAVSAANPAGFSSIAFLPNRGQLADQVGYYADTPVGSLYLTPDGLFFGLIGDDEGALDSGTVLPFWMRFEGHDPGVKMIGSEASPGVVNIFTGEDPNRWMAGLPQYTTVEYRGLYPGIDLLLRGVPQSKGSGFRLKETYLLAPGADPASIRLFYEGTRGVTLGGGGELAIQLGSPAGENRSVTLSDPAPVAWQTGSGGARLPVDIRYRLLQDGRVGFEVGDYDPSHPLLIDPELEYSTYLGGSGTDEGFDIAIDGARSPIVVGTTISVDFPTDFPLDEPLAGNRNVFVTKFSRDGTSIEFSDYFGGTADDIARSVSVDSTGEIYLTGTTSSADFPTTRPATTPEESGQNLFVIKLSLAGGQMRYSLVYGGSGDDESWSIIADDTGSAYVAGVTSSTDFPTYDPFQPVSAGGRDGFVMKFGSLGDQVYSSYLGGSGEDEAHGVAVDRKGSALVTGVTVSEDFPIRAAPDDAAPIQGEQSGNRDAFLTKLTPDGGGLIFSTYLGAEEGSVGNDVTTDRDGNAYLVGTVDVLGGGDVSGSSDVLVISIGADGREILYQTVFGGSEDEEGNAIGIDRDRNVYVAGETDSDNLATSGVIQAGFNGNGDALISQLGPGGDLITTHYVGGTAYDSGRGIAVAGNGDAFIAGVTFSTDFPTVNAFQSVYRGDGDVFMLKIGEIEFIPTPVPTDTPPPPPPPPPPTATPTAVQGFVQSDTFLYLLLGLTAFVFLLMILDFVLGRIRRRRRK